MNQDAIIRTHRLTKKYARRAGLNPEICNHTFRATGITQFLKNGGCLEEAQRLAAHSSAKTTKLYDRTGEVIEQAHVERIQLT